MHGDQPLVPDGQAPVAREPGEGPLHLPAVMPEPVLRLDAAGCDAVLYPALHAYVAAPRVVVAFVGVELRRTAAGAPRAARAHGHHHVEQRLEHPAVVDVGRGQRDRERDAFAVNQEVVLAARLALVGRVRADRGSPFFAAKLRLSRLARVQSIRSAAARRSSMS